MLQTAYESHTLGDKNVQTQLLAAVPCLALQHMVRSAKQVLLYLRSTVENFGQVSALLFLPALHLQSVLLSESAPQCSEYTTRQTPALEPGLLALLLLCWALSSSSRAEAASVCTQDKGPPVVAWTVVHSQARSSRFVSPTAHC